MRPAVRSQYLCGPFSPGTWRNGILLLNDPDLEIWDIKKEDVI